MKKLFVCVCVFFLCVFFGLAFLINFLVNNFSVIFGWSHRFLIYRYFGNLKLSCSMTLFLIYFVLGASYLIGINAINITSEHAKTFKCNYCVVRTEDFTMSVNRRSDKGTHTPPMPVHMSAAGQPRTRIPVPVTYSQNAGVGAGAYDSCQETSSILSKLYVTPENIYPTQSMAVRTQFAAPQDKQQSVTTGDFSPNRTLISTS